MQRGEIIDAATGELSGKEAFLEMLRWKAGNFEILASRHAAAAHDFQHRYESLLMETAQSLDEAAADAHGADASRAGGVFALQRRAVRRRGGERGQNEI